ncbi:MAG TPA: polyprenol monophosphomannose synthase [Terriglobales bacterium]|nr:polyprenol monophosphomannose synthase [Terriglobales bacterium]
MMREARPPRFAVVLPTYNEAANIERVVRTLQEVFSAAGLVEHEIVIVDDDSPDGTGSIADTLAAASGGRVRSVRRQGERGLATAVVAGWKTSSAPVLAAMDADGQHPPDVIPRLLEALERGADLAVASRYTAGGDIPRWNIVRRLGSKFATFLVRLALPAGVRQVRDPLSGCFALRREVIEGVELKPLGFKILLEVMIRGRVRRLEEVPFVFAPRGAGKSKLGARVAILDALQLLRSSWQSRRSRAS